MMCFVLLLNLLVVLTSSSLIHTAWQHQWLLPPPSVNSSTSADTEERITHGQEASPGQFPYQCGLRMVFGTNMAWCGCTIISDRWVLTAAHCTNGAESGTVIVGAHNIKDEQEEHQQRIQILESSIVVHEGWNPTTLVNDISVIKLPHQLKLNDYIQPAKLPKLSSANSTYEGEIAWASGWGKDSDKANTISTVLRYIQVEIMQLSLCNDYYFGIVTDGMICINTRGGTSTCNGDSGGPLIYKEGEVNYLIGTTSFGISLGCEKGWPAVFTRITSYLDWINEKTGVVTK